MGYLKTGGGGGGSNEPLEPSLDPPLERTHHTYSDANTYCHVHIYPERPEYFDQCGYVTLESHLIDLRRRVTSGL